MKEKTGVYLNFKKYEHPKTAVFKKHTDRYVLPEGWQYDEQQLLVTGEYNSHYEYDNKHTIHKSFFIRWVETQLNLFN